MVKYFAFDCVMSATALAGVVDSRRTTLLSFGKPTHIQMRSEFLFGVTTIGAHHSAGSGMGTIMPWLTSRSISLSL